METLTPDERAAIRAFLQRSDARLSTIHRVATALLSGAGLMVLLPAIARDWESVTVLALPFVALRRSMRRDWIRRPLSCSSRPGGDAAANRPAARRLRRARPRRRCQRYRGR